MLYVFTVASVLASPVTHLSLIKHLWEVLVWCVRQRRPATRTLLGLPQTLPFPFGEITKTNTLIQIMSHIKSEKVKTDEQAYGRTERRTNGWPDGLIDEQADYYRVPSSLMRGPNNSILQFCTQRIEY